MNKDREAIHTLSKVHPIVFFDGVCGLCNGVVNWIIAKDKSGRFRFAALQGETAFLSLNETDRRDLDSIVILKNTSEYRRSTAVIEILLELDLKWRLVARLMQIIPRPLRDVGYRVIAKCRYRIWGKSDICRMPTPEERLRFLA